MTLPTEEPTGSGSAERVVPPVAVAEESSTGTTLSRPASSQASPSGEAGTRARRLNKQLQVLVQGQTLPHDSQTSGAEFEALFSPTPQVSGATNYSQEYQELMQLTSPVTLPTPTNYMFTPPEHSFNLGRKAVTPTAYQRTNAVERKLDLSPLSEGTPTQDSIGNSDSPTHNGHPLHALMRQGMKSPVSAADIALAQQQLMLLSNAVANQASAQLPTALRPRQPPVAGSAQPSREPTQASEGYIQQSEPTQSVYSVPSPERPPVSTAERSLLQQVEACLLDKATNPHGGSVAVVVVQRAVMDKCSEDYENAVKKGYAGSFHAFLRAHPHLKVFHYDAQTISDWGLTHCSPHEGRLMYADIAPEEIRRQDQQTCAWKKNESSRLLGLLEELVRREPMPMRLLLDRFREHAEQEGFSAGQIPSNHAVRQTLKKNTERFAITAEAIVKIPEQLTAQEREDWEQKLRAIRGKAQGQHPAQTQQQQRQQHRQGQQHQQGKQQQHLKQQQQQHVQQPQQQHLQQHHVQHQHQLQHQQVQQQQLQQRQLLHQQPVQHDQQQLQQLLLQQQQQQQIQLLQHHHQQPHEQPQQQNFLLQQQLMVQQHQQQVARDLQLKEQMLIQQEKALAQQRQQLQQMQQQASNPITSQLLTQQLLQQPYSAPTAGMDVTGVLSPTGLNPQLPFAMPIGGGMALSPVHSAQDPHGSPSSLPAHC